MGGWGHVQTAKADQEVQPPSSISRPSLHPLQDNWIFRALFREEYRCLKFTITGQQYFSHSESSLQFDLSIMVQTIGLNINPL